ncbi:head GIN domain-containing protein [Algibacter pectinivorans]|uniref:Putative auto-transporter adhesin, head GIN domain n=1 Tax=Algibacter pectinivorans TaxID=870482 RepID=A0A1I1NFV5_9FLAO|nr:head GIN domain-containing protein [Algibacter pectinivorans]SFC96509.1 Putative auto-transporter adhesin, head GIN domain [Algibacter pectinivorans]
MKTLIKVIVLFVTTVCLAQNPIEKTVGEFGELKVYDLIEVELIKSDINKVSITGKNAADVLVNNKNGTLKIKMKLEEAFDGNNTKVKLYYTNLDVIDANEGAKVHSNDVIEQFEIDLNAQEGASIDVKVDVKYTNVRAVTGGSVIASGKSNKQNISIYTGGIYNGKDLTTNVSEVSIRAAGEAQVNATKKVIAKVRAGGEILIYGNPEEIEESKILGGRITKAEE